MSGYGDIEYGDEVGYGFYEPEGALGVPPLGWGIQQWGLDCWGGICQESILFYSWQPACDSLNNLRSPSVSFGIKPSDSGDQIVQDSIIITLEIDDIIYTPGCGNFVGWDYTTTVYQSSAFNSPWDGSVNAVGNGFEFSITPPDYLPPNAKVCITAYAESQNELSATEECCWYAGDFFCITMEIISLTKIIVRLSDKLLSTNSGITTAANWEIIPVGGGFIDDVKNVVGVKTVIPDSSRNPQYAVLNTTKMVWNQRYQVRCKNLVDIYNRTVGGDALFIMRRTKVDHILDKLPSVWEVDGTSNFFWLLAAFAKIDEAIGGSIRDVDI